MRLAALLVVLGACSTPREGWLFFSDPVDGHLSLRDLGAGTTQALNDTRSINLIASDQQQIAYVAGSQVFIVDVTGHTEVVGVVGNTPALQWRTAGWLVYSAASDGIPGTGLARAGAPSRLLPTKSTLGPLSITSDGQWVAYATAADDLILEATDGSASRTLINVPGVSEIAFSPDDASVVVRAGPELHRVALGDGSDVSLGPGGLYGSVPGLQRSSSSSYDGDHVLLYGADGTSTLSLSSGTRTLVAPAASDWHGARAFFLDDGRVVHSLSRNTTGTDSLILHEDITLISADRVATTPIADAPEPCRAELARSGRIAVLCAGEARIVDAATTHIVARTPAASLVGMSGDGTRLIVVDPDDIVATLRDNGDVTHHGGVAVSGTVTGPAYVSE